MAPVPTVDSVPAQTHVDPTPAATSIKSAVAPLATSSLPDHPLDPLSEKELLQASFLIRQSLTESPEYSDTKTPKAFRFAYISTLEPPKLEVLNYLGIPLSLDGETPKPKAGTPPKRKAEAAVIEGVSGKSFNAIVDLSVDGGKVEKIKQLPDGVQPGITLEELVLAEKTVKKDARVLKLCEDVGIKPEQVFADGWSLGWDDRFDPKARLQQCFMYARLSEHENLYAHPLDFNVVVDANTEKVIHIDFAPHRVNPGKTLSSIDGETKPVPISHPDAFKASGRDRIPPPLERHDYLPDLLAENDPKYKLRDDIKPLHVSQPEGVSFKMDGNQISWQKWQFHIGFHYREGLVLSTITYNDDGVVRPIFYRLSLAEMVVPYGSPEWPHPRKFAFDVGEYGIGILCNSLSLGCDCLGEIHYLDGVLSDHAGRPIVIKNAVCIHEEDAGLLWKHTDYRPNGRAHAVRSRKLVVSCIATVANYEYMFYFNFFQDGTIHLEVKLSGILNLYVLAQGESAKPYGTEVAPRVMAHYHQHLFCLRVDPIIDGINNTVVQTDVVPLPDPTGSAANYAGNGFVATKKVLENTEEDGIQNWSSEKGRIWSVVNESKGSQHYASGEPGGYKIMTKDLPPLLPKPDSIVAMRAPFAKNHLWVTPYQDGQIYPAGKYVPQTIATPEDSISNWVKGKKNLRNEDLVCYLTFGTTHIPRPEDYPVMPVEMVSVTFKPSNFFRQNPSLDVPQLKDINSKNAFTKVAEGSNGVATNGTNGCCH